jgi:hypothetical protein
MEKFHTFYWNDFNKEYTMVILNDNDIQNEIELNGVGFEILVIPIKYKNTSNNYLNNWIMITKCRNGKIIYV